MQTEQISAPQEKIEARITASDLQTQLSQLRAERGR